MATGSEVGLAVTAAEMLAKDGIKAAVVSMPSFELFRNQPEAYQRQTLGAEPRIAIEAGVQQSWNEWLRPGDHFVGLSGFGASAPAPKVYAHFGLTAERVAEVGKEIKKRS
jgi:transketolase